MNISYNAIHFARAVSSGWYPRDDKGEIVYAELVGRDNPGVVVYSDVTPNLLDDNSKPMIHPNALNTLYLGGHVRTQAANAWLQSDLNSTDLDALGIAVHFNECRTRRP